MSMTEAPYSITFKTPKGNLFTIRGNTAGELKANLNAAPDEGVITLISQIEATLAGQPKASAASRPANPTPAASGEQRASQAQPSASPVTAADQSSQQLPEGMGEPACETCGGPTRFDKAGISQKSGLPYRRYLCTANQLHRATFA